MFTFLRLAQLLIQRCESQLRPGLQRLLASLVTGQALPGGAEVAQDLRDSILDIIYQVGWAREAWFQPA